jgi:hypothetical protein
LTPEDQGSTDPQNTRQLGSSQSTGLQSLQKKFPLTNPNRTLTALKSSDFANPNQELSFAKYNSNWEDYKRRPGHRPTTMDSQKQGESARENYRPITRKFPQYNLTTAKNKPSYDEIIHNRGKGTFSSKNEGSHEVWKPHVHRNDSYHTKERIDDANYKRGPKMCTTKHSNRDPITDGDPSGNLAPRTRVPPKMSDQLNILNERSIWALTSPKKHNERISYAAVNQSRNLLGNDKFVTGHTKRETYLSPRMRGSTAKELLQMGGPSTYKDKVIFIFLGWRINFSVGILEKARER